MAPNTTGFVRRHFCCSCLILPLERLCTSVSGPRLVSRSCVTFGEECMKATTSFSLFLLILASTTLWAQNAPSTEPAAPATGINLIQHVVFIVKENPTLDSYFGTFPGANGATSGLASNGRIVPLIHEPDSLPRDIGHDWFSSHLAINGGQNKGFDLIPGDNSHGRLHCGFLFPPPFLQNEIPH